MRNTNKYIIHIHKHRAGQYLLFFDTHWLLFKNFTEIQKVVVIKENFASAKKTRSKMKQNADQIIRKGCQTKMLISKTERDFFLLFTQQNIVI